MLNPSGMLLESGVVGIVQAEMLATTPSKATRRVAIRRGMMTTSGQEADARGVKTRLTTRGICYL